VRQFGCECVGPLFFVFGPLFLLLRVLLGQVGTLLFLFLALSFLFLLLLGQVGTFLPCQDRFAGAGIDQPQHVTFRHQAQTQFFARQAAIGSGDQRLIFPTPQAEAAQRRLEVACLRIEGSSPSRAVGAWA